MATATCDFRFSLQNRYAEDSLVNALKKLGISNQAVTFSGRATLGEREISKEDFIGASVEEIRTRLKSYLEEHEPRAGDLVILDMEPQGIAPVRLGEFTEDKNKKLLRDLIAAYRRRIRVARQELRKTRKPGLKLGLYQVIVPDGKGEESEEFKRRMRGYVEAGEQGMYDQLDFICPVLYQRFEPDDATPETLRRWLARSTRQAIEGSLKLSRRNGSRIPLVPVLSFWVFNKRPPNHPVRPAVAPESLARQLQIVQDAVGIEAILFWSAWQTKPEMETAKKPVEPIVIDDFLDSVGSLPWPGCT
jgi:hypothetical protein